MHTGEWTQQFEGSFKASCKGPLRYSRITDSKHPFNIFTSDIQGQNCSISAPFGNMFVAIASKQWYAYRKVDNHRTTKREAPHVSVLFKLKEASALCSGSHKQVADSRPQPCNNKERSPIG